MNFLFSPIRENVTLEVCVRTGILKTLDRIDLDLKEFGRDKVLEGYAVL
jgi:hypothetical protein